jgi:hypothetical protein
VNDFLITTATLRLLELKLDLGALDEASELYNEASARWPGHPRLKQAGTLLGVALTRNVLGERKQTEEEGPRPPP